MEQNIYPITLGRKGIDNYLMKYATGEEIPWPTAKQIAEWKRLYPRDLKWERAVKEGREKQYLRSLGLF